MLILIIFTCLVTNISVIKCREMYVEMNVEIGNKDNCTVDKEFKLPPGTGVVIRVTDKSNKKLRKAKVEKVEANETEEYVFKQIDKTTFIPYFIPNNNSNQSYTLFFTFSHELGQGQLTTKRNLCRTLVFYEPSPYKTPISPGKLPETWHTYLAIGGVAAGIMVIALLATTMYYKRQANLLSKQTILEIRAERADEIDRYCSNPRKDKKDPILNNNRESEIYEDPGITLGVPSRPPALPTTPRPNRNYNNTVKKPASPSMTLKSNASHVSLTRPRGPDKETQIKLTMAQRPPLPLPQDEFYPESPDDTYEEPPIPERPTPSSLARRPGQPERNGTIPKKIVKPVPENIAKPRPEKMPKNFEEKFGKTLQNIPMNGLRPPGSLQRPAVPTGKPTPPRNNVVQVPIRQIPDSSLKKAPIVKPKPNAKPKAPPSPPVEQVPFHNEERRDSTDDEYWTYEPLPQYNIYNN